MAVLEVMALLDTRQDLDLCALEMGCAVGQLLTPSSRHQLRDPARPWAIDNSAFAEFEPRVFDALLRREEYHKDKCLFVTTPDVVGSARRTLEVFERFKDRLAGWPLALACQDGQHDLPIPWDDIRAVFIGGSTNFKCGEHATHIIKAAKLLGKWVHVGRVNTPGRFQHFNELGVDSIDGTGLAQYSHMREAIGTTDQQIDLEDYLA